jgi:glycosyltransferase involved in cell wall biosynthesis
VQTQSTANYFPKKFQKSIQIIPNPVVTPAKQKTGILNRVKNIISVGSLTPQKNQTTAILMFSKLAPIFPELTLTIYGEGTKRNNLEQLITNLNLKNRVFLPGTTKDINKALLEADLFIFPSEYEGFPNALCEAMAIGLPVIASNCSGNIDIIRDKIDGRLFPVGDVETLTNIATELIEDYKQRQLLSENAKTVCDRFGVNKIFNTWDKSIDDCTIHHLTISETSTH